MTIEEQEPQEDINRRICTPRFNDLGWAGKRSLEVYAAAMSISSFMREDTRLYPWRYPFYAAYFVTWISPWPPMASTAMTIATVAFAMSNISNYSRRLKNHLTDAFNRSSMMETFKDHIVARRPDAEALKVKMWSLSKYAMVEIGKDSAIASRYAWEAFDRARTKAYNYFMNSK